LKKYNFQKGEIKTMNKKLIKKIKKLETDLIIQQKANESLIKDNIELVEIISNKNLILKMYKNLFFKGL
jgi:hypothetical protein